MIVDWIRTHSHEITEAARQVLYMLLGFEFLVNQRGQPWTDSQIALVLSAISALMALVASKTTVAASKVDQRVAEGRAKGYAEGVRVTESGTGGPFPPAA